MARFPLGIPGAKSTFPIVLVCLYSKFQSDRICEMPGQNSKSKLCEPMKIMGNDLYLLISFRPKMTKLYVPYLADHKRKSHLVFGVC